MYLCYLCFVLWIKFVLSIEERGGKILTYNTKEINNKPHVHSQTLTYEQQNKIFIPRLKRQTDGLQTSHSIRNQQNSHNEENVHSNVDAGQGQEFISDDIREGGGSRRVKVEKLGNTLRKRVSKLRSRKGVDLVFLVDSSASVGSQNFYNEIKFIRKLLADFTVSINTTRVVVITYSSVDRVIKQIDHISDPKEDYHKCNLLDQEIPAITYNSGGTYTLGALLQAIDVFQYSRRLSSKAVFLITDGYSNGGDPRPAAELLKTQLGVHIFTFGIRNGNVKELRDMASKPEDEHAYILDSFEEFEALARRALHEDISNGEYIPQNNEVCSRLCNNKNSGGVHDSYDGANAAYSSSSRTLSRPPGSLRSQGFGSNFVMSPRQQLASANLPYWHSLTETPPVNCCDPLAACSCGTHTGHFACVCPSGYYGRGLIGDCKRCPQSTYKPSADPGDIRSCLKCPHEHQTSPLGSNSVDMCTCKENYLWQNGRCTVQDCPQLEAPSNGYFVHNECFNVFNSACGIRCNTGYDLTNGDSLRTCKPNGQWSGRQPICELRQCRLLTLPLNGSINCQRHPNAFPISSLGPDISTIGERSNANQPSHVDTQCTFSCNEGYRLVGSTTRICLPIALWTGIQATCKPIRCPRLRRPNYGEIYPGDCTRSRKYFGTRCAFSCHAGFQLQGPSLRQCVAPGRWNGGNLMTRCVDVTPPVLRCPENITSYTDDGLHYATLNMTMPVSQDNSGFVPTIVSVPALTENMKFKIGTTEIKIGSTDLTGNINKCTFFVTVIDDQPPIVDFCRSPPIFLVDNPDDIKKGMAMIDWSEPIFHDNSVTPLTILRTPDRMELPNVNENISPNAYEGIGMGLFRIGESVTVSYTAIDASGNNSTCKLDITVQEHYCLLPSDPINGNKNCSENQEAIFCTLACEDGFSFAYQPLDDYFCPYNNTEIFGYVDDLDYQISHEREDLIQDYNERQGIFAVPSKVSEEEYNYSDSAIEIVMAAHLPNSIEKNTTSSNITRSDFEYTSPYSLNIGLARPVEDTQDWLPESNPPPFPDCSVVSHSSLVVTMPTSLSFEFASSDGNENEALFEDDYYDQDTNSFPQSACDDQFFLGKVSEALGSKLRLQLDKICDSSLNCEMSDLESLCEEVLEEDESSVSTINVNGKEPVSRKKRSVIPQASTPPLAILPSFITPITTRSPRLLNPNSIHLTSRNNRIYKNSRAKLRWAVLRKKRRRRRRRTRIKLLFKMIGKVRNERTQMEIGPSTNGSFHTAKVMNLQSKMKSVESAVRQVSSTANDTINESINQSLQHNQTSNPDNEEINNDQKQNSSSLKFSGTKYSKWTLSSYETSTHMKPIEIKCKVGSILKNDLCVNCPVGSYQNYVLNKCVPCPKGTYQDVDGKTQCISCPPLTSTRKNVGGKSGSDCKGFCHTGSYSKDGLEPCTTCPIGSYQTVRGSNNCYNCPNETSTVHRGTTTEDVCLPLCPKGYASETGLALFVSSPPIRRPSGCQPCPSGYFQEIEGQRYCRGCPNEAKSRNDREATVSVFECDGITRINWDAEDNQNLTKLQVDECFSNPCQNGGNCQKLEQSGFTCICKKGFGGTFCETEINYCASFPCMNGGSCSNNVITSSSFAVSVNETIANQSSILKILNKKFVCKCLPEFQGLHCEWDVNECLISPCLNGGHCYNAIGSFECICLEGYRGPLCEFEVDDCETHACQNGATCIDGMSKYNCQCPSGFTGQFCEEDIDECLSRPCSNGASCIDERNGFSCVCMQGYQGQFCETDVDECSLYVQHGNVGNAIQEFSNITTEPPCLNGGTCIDDIAKTNCICPPGFDGNRCEKELDPNFVLVFGPNDFSNVHSGGTYEYALLGGELPDLSEFTFCFWMATDDKGNYGTPISYATQLEDNEITFTDPFGFVLSVKGQKVVTDITGNDGAWTFMCASWVSMRGEWNIYKNGIIADRGNNLAKGKVVKGKGAFVLGQEQDSFGGDFSSAESYHGKISQFNLWNTRLNDSQILNIMYSCNEKENSFAQNSEMIPNAINQKHLRDSLVISWADFRRENTINGFVKVEYLPLCHGCPALSPPTHGYVRITPSEDISSPNIGALMNSRRRSNINSTSNYKATYSCQEGFMLTQGDRVRTCGVLGDWRGRQPLCRLIDCGFPGYLVNGYVLGASHLYGDIVRYTCRPGYRLYGGDATQRCARSGHWSGRRPTCKAITCRLNEPFPNGRVLNPRINYGIGQSIRFECKDSSLVMDGPNQLECLDDGTWSDMLPTCMRKLLCTDLPRISNGYVDLNNNTPNQTENFEATHERDSFKNKTGIVKCNEGFTLDNPYKKSLLCRDGIWNLLRNEMLDVNDNFSEDVAHNFPKCQEILCKRNPFILNSRLLKQPHSTNYNATAKFSCIPGYQFVFIEKLNVVKNNTAVNIDIYTTPPTLLINDRENARKVKLRDVLTLSFKCLEDETWITQYKMINSSLTNDSIKIAIDNVKCLPMKCDVPNAPQKGMVEFSGLDVGSMARYSCERQYQLKGRAQRRCLYPEGRWSYDAPRCIPT